jgi:hypothetical protein
MSVPAASWCDPAGESPAQVRGSVRLVASVAWPLATVGAKRTQRLHGVRFYSMHSIATAARNAEMSMRLAVG